jgi:hypothetical protein
MGIDTRYWGGSGWELFHTIAFHSNPAVLKNMGEILPCKFCRNSTMRFMKKHPLKNPARWVYEIHNMVNDKLRTQCKDDPKVVNPGEDPTFEEVERKYRNKKVTNLGDKFLLSIAVNFTRTPKRLDIQKRFLSNLAISYPEFGKYYKENPPNFSHYAEWMNGFVKGSIEEVKSFQSKCKHGKTCRKKGGSRRRLARTQRLS